MNICVISPGYPYKENMYYVFVKKLVDEWAKKGHRCVVLTSFSWTAYIRGLKRYVPWHYTDDNCKENPVEVYNARYISVPEIKIGGVEVNSAMVSKRIYSLFKKIKFNPDIVYCHFFSSAISGWYITDRLNVPLFVASGESTIDNVNPPSRDFTLTKLKNRINGCICVSTKNKEEAIGKGLITEDKCKILPNGTDLSIFKKLDRTECRQRLGFSKDDFIVCCVGAFNERKGQSRIVDAVKKLANPRIKMVFIGKGDLAFEHENIIYKGQVKNSNIPIYLNASDVFCLPTLAEGCCNAIIEAMACGLPIVSSDLSFNYDVLDADNSILVAPRNVDEIAQAIKTLYEDENKRNHFSQSSLVSIKPLSIEGRADAVLHYFDSSIR